MVTWTTCIKCNEAKFVRAPRSRQIYCEECKLAVLRESCKTYKANNRDKIKAYNKKSKEENKEHNKAQTKIWRETNRDIINEKQNKYHAERYKSDFNFKLSCTMRNKLYKVLHGSNSDSLSKLLGCDYEMLKQWLEFQFDSEMTHENHGSMWHIDHVIPCACFDLEKSNQQEMCFHWTNIQPLEASKNMIKRDTLSLREIHLHEIKISAFIRQNKSLFDARINRYEQYEIVRKDC